MLAMVDDRIVHNALTAAIDSLLESSERNLKLTRDSDPMSHAWIAHMAAVHITVALTDALCEARKAVREG